MIRSVLLVLLLLASGDAVAAQRLSTGALNYTCTNDGDPAKAECVCKGWFDCRTMVRDGVCKAGQITGCKTPGGTGPETCSCQWKTSIQPKAGNVAPSFEMQSK